MTTRNRLSDEQIDELWQSYRYGRDDGAEEDLTLWDIADVYRMGYETLRTMPSLLAELRTRRTADLTPDEVEAIEWVRHQCKRAEHGHPTHKTKTALAVLDKLIGGAR